jgi:hypothetical protein
VIVCMTRRIALPICTPRGQCNIAIADQPFTGTRITVAMSLWQMEFASPLSQTILTPLQSLSVTVP